MTVRRTLAAVAGALALVVPLAAPAAAGPTDGSAGIGDPYFPLDGNGGIDVEHYAIADRWDPSSKTLSGTTTLSITTTRELRTFHLDFLLSTSRVRVDGYDATLKRTDPHELRVDLGRTVPKGTDLEVALTYSDKPGKHAYDGERNWLSSSTETVAMNQPHMAPWWFPSNDHPRDKATFDIDVTVPYPHRVVANGLPHGHTRDGRWTTYRWKAEQPMSTYLAFFAAGRLDVESGTSAGRPWVNAVSQKLSSAGRRDAMTWLKRSPGVVRWLESEIGRYPFASTGGVVTGLDVGFALENQTRPTYGSWGIGDDSLLVHELAHQWFGDSLGVRSWRDIWLNEGFATYYEYRYRESRGGETTTTWMRDLYDAIPSTDPFWRLSVSDPGADHIFDEPIYERGGMTLAALRRVVGATTFSKIVRSWAKAHDGGSVTTTEFRALAEKVSGKDLDGFFDAWLDARRKPARTAANGLR